MEQPSRIISIPSSTQEKKTWKRILMTEWWYSICPLQNYESSYLGFSEKAHQCQHVKVLMAALASTCVHLNGSKLKEQPNPTNPFWLSRRCYSIALKWQDRKKKDKNK